MKIRFLVIFFIAVAFVSKAQTVTDPWASMGGPTTPSLIAIDASNNLYVTNFSNSTISKITPAGTVTQAWATLAANTYPYGIVIDASGNLYTANRGPKTISKITPLGDGTSGSVIQTWADLGGDEAYTLAIDASGNVYVPYVSTNRIAKITPNGATGTINTTWVTLASGANPFSISFDGSGNLYSANSNNTISKITAAGSVTQAWATLAASSNPQFMVFDPAGNMYVSCWGTSKVAKINSTGTVTDNWSVGTNVWTAGIVLDGAGNVYTTNHNNHTISKITPSGTVTQAYVTLANGANPFHLVKDASGNLYTNNMGNHTVTKILVPSVSITSSASGAVCAGTSVTFTATVTGISSPTYQWYKNGTAISGEISASYTTSSLANADQIYVTATPGYTSGSISTSNLIANFDAANYNTSSTRWNDLSTSANHMDLYTDRTYATLKTATYSTDGGGSLILNNNSVYGKTINNTGISGNGGKTMSAWVKFDATDQDWASIASIGEYVAGKLFEIYAQRNGASTQLIFHWSGSQLSNYADLPKDTWYYVTIKSDGSSINYIYINGVQVAYTTQALNITNSPLYMGAPKSYSEGGWNYNLRGRISTLSLYNTSLSAQTILDNYNATKGRYTAVPGYTSNALVSSINAAPATPTITVTGDGCVNKTTLSTASGLTSYAWYKNNIAISGATSNTYSPTSEGSYQVHVSDASCSSTSTTTTINNCGNNAYGQMVTLTNSSSLISTEGGANFGTGKDISGKIFNTTNIASTSGTIGSTTAVLGGVISSTTGLTSSVGIIYSTDVNFGTYSTTTIQSNIAAGTYTSTISGLSSSTNYFAKSFIVNKAGTTYGSVVNFTTSAPPVTPVTNGLMLYLDATKSASYGGSGTTWNDISGQLPAGSATLVGNPPFASGSFTFGSNMNASTSKTYTIGNQLTLIAWVNPSQQQSTFTGVIFRRTSSDGGGTGMFLSGNNLHYDWDNQHWGWRSNITVPNEQWSMIVLSIKESELNVYLCNASGIISDSRGNGHGSLTSKGATNFHIGYDPYDLSNRAFRGKMGTAMVYSVGLSTEDITTIFNEQKAAFGL